MLFKVVIKFLLALSFVLGSHKLWAVNSKYASNSVLATGTWKKVRIEKNGVYKITYAELLKMGFNDPMKVSVLGYGGWPLDEDFTKPYIDEAFLKPILTVVLNNAFVMDKITSILPNDNPAIGNLVKAVLGQMPAIVEGTTELRFGLNLKK